MSQVYCIRRRTTGKHLVYAERQELEYLVTQDIKASKKKKKTQKNLAQLLKGRSCLLVLVEKMTRETIIFKLSSQTQSEIQKRLDRLERKMGKNRFPKKFKSITVDNDSEVVTNRETLRYEGSSRKGATIANTPINRSKKLRPG